MIRVNLPHRGTDTYGSGDYLASRGPRKHAGVDYACVPNSEVFSPVQGVITKLGYAYGDDLTFRYVESTDNNGLRHRVFYIFPAVEVGDEVDENSIIGLAQDLSPRYPGIIPHVHYEIRDANNDHRNPEL